MEFRRNLNVCIRENENTQIVGWSLLKAYVLNYWDINLKQDTYALYPLLWPGIGFKLIKRSVSLSLWSNHELGIILHSNFSLFLCPYLIPYHVGGTTSPMLRTMCSNSDLTTNPNPCARKWSKLLEFQPA